MARVGLAEASIVVLPGGQVAISMLLVDEAVVFLDKSRVVLRVGPLTFELVVLNLQLGAFRVEDLGLALAVLSATCTYLNVSTNLV